LRRDEQPEVYWAIVAAALIIVVVLLGLGFGGW
jgi:hypothetical protein